MANVKRTSTTTRYDAVTKPNRFDQAFAALEENKAVEEKNLGEKINETAEVVEEPIKESVKDNPKAEEPKETQDKVSKQKKSAKENSKTDSYLDAFAPKKKKGCSKMVYLSQESHDFVDFISKETGSTFSQVLDIIIKKYKEEVEE